MVRVVLTVALALAVLGVCLPAVQQAGVQRSDAAARAAVDDLITSARALAADSDAFAPDLANARRVVELDLPTDRTAQAGLVVLRIEPPERTTDATAGVRNGTRVVWRVDGGTRHVRQVPDVRLRPPPKVQRRGNEAVVLRSGGQRHVVLELVRVDGRRVVWVHLEDRPD